MSTQRGEDPLHMSRFIRDRPTPRDRTLRLLLAAVTVCGTTAPAWAHGFGQRYELPLPLSLYLFGAVVTVVFSFVVVGLFVTSMPRERGYPTIALSGVI